MYCGAIGGEIILAEPRPSAGSDSRVAPTTAMGGIEFEPSPFKEDV
jgi:hypothetical protein